MSDVVTARPRALRAAPDPDPAKTLGAPELDGFNPLVNVDAERVVLGAAMCSRDAFADVVAIIGLDPEPFYGERNRAIWGAIVAVAERCRPDVVLVAEELRRRGRPVTSGDASYLHSLISSVPTAANGGYYAAIVAERYQRREAVRIARQFAQDAMNLAAPLDAIYGRHRDQLAREPHWRGLSARADGSDTAGEVS